MGVGYRIFFRGFQVVAAGIRLWTAMESSGLPGYFLPDY
jgi:hypothetical protein